MRKRFLAHRKRRSSALIITMLGVVLLTIIVVAFMQTMALSLTTSKSYTDIQRASLAAEAGMDTAIAEITLATGTNLAFVTGQTNYPSANTPVTVIGMGNLTNLDQMMPLISGPVVNLTNFGASGFSNNFSTYASALTSGIPAQSVDVNTPYQFIQVTSDQNIYRAPWVTMTNVVGSRVSYTRYAYVVLDDSARVNPALMTGAGTGYSDQTNWYGGPQDVSLTNSGAQLLTPSQMVQVVASTNSFVYSDASLGETFVNRATYEASKHLFTSRSNLSFDVVPAWLPYGGRPKFNINDLATNPIYGSTPQLRAMYIAGVITNNLPNFYLRDPALSPTNQTLYVNRLAADMVTYISPDSTWGPSEYTNNTTGISPQVSGVYPVFIAEQVSCPTTGSVATAFWLNCWNPNTTPVAITNAVLHVWRRPSYYLGNTNAVTFTPDYLQTNNYISNANTIARPNEFITLGFPSLTNSLNVTGKTLSAAQTFTNSINGGDSAPYEQYSLMINGQTVSQSPNQPNTCGLQMDVLLDGNTQGNNTSTNAGWNVFECIGYDNQGSTAGDPRFQNYQYTIWEATHDAYAAATYWNGAQPIGSAWYPWNTWGLRDNIARPPVKNGNMPPDTTRTPGALLANKYQAATDASGAPEFLRNGPMLSIGELGHIFDPAYANELLTTAIIGPNGKDKGGFKGIYLNGGGRSLRIGRPESTGASISTGAPTSASWDQTGERAISLVDLFTVNSTNLVSGGSLGRINPNTASTNVIAAMLSGIQITSDSGMTNSSGTLISPLVLTNVPTMAAIMQANRPYSSLSDFYKTMPIFDAYTNYYPNLPLNSSGYLNVVNRVHQEAFGKLIQHLTVQSRSYRVYVIGQVLDSSQNPHGSVAVEAGVYLQYDQANAKYKPVIQYVRLLK